MAIDPGSAWTGPVWPRAPGWVIDAFAGPARQAGPAERHPTHCRSPGVLPSANPVRYTPADIAVRSRLKMSWPPRPKWWLLDGNRGADNPGREEGYRVYRRCHFLEMGGPRLFPNALPGLQRSDEASRRCVRARAAMASHWCRGASHHLTPCTSPSPDQGRLPVFLSGSQVHRTGLMRVAKGWRSGGAGVTRGLKERKKTHAVV